MGLLCWIAAALAVAQPATAPSAKPAAETTSPGAPSRLEAVGVVRSPSAGRSVAILLSDGRSRVVALGETAFGARLVSIEEDHVTLEVDGRALQLRLARSMRPPAAEPAVAPAPRPAEGPPEDPATPARDMDRRQVQVRLGEEMNRILTETAVVPVLEDGRVTGVQLTRIAEGSLLTDAGLRPGDVLTRINGTPIDGMATLIGMWPRLQNASELQAVVLRAGQPVSLRVLLR